MSDMTDVTARANAFFSGEEHGPSSDPTFSWPRTRLTAPPLAKMLDPRHLINRTVDSIGLSQYQYKVILEID